MTGYQQGILCALGTTSEGRYVVRTVDRWYCDSIANICGTAVYKSDYNVERDGRPQWVIKSTSVSRPELSDVTDWVGFCRAYIEIHGIVDLKTCRRRDGSHYYTPRLRIYGRSDMLTAVMLALPVPAKRIYDVRNRINDKYVGNTSVVYYQSAAEVATIVTYLQGEPCNEKIHEKWHRIITG